MKRGKGKRTMHRQWPQYFSFSDQQKAVLVAWKITKNKFQIVNRTLTLLYLIRILLAIITAWDANASIPLKLGKIQLDQHTKHGW